MSWIKMNVVTVMFWIVVVFTVKLLVALAPVLFAESLHETYQV